MTTLFRLCTGSGVIAGLMFVGLAMASPPAAEEKAEKARKPIILVPPFENQSNHRENIKYEVHFDRANNIKRVFTIDRFCHAPRTLFEDAMGSIPGVTIVERQRADTLLAESEFGQMIGLVDTEKAIKLGKVMGANLIVVGTITSLSDETKRFSGYGVETEKTTATCQMRIRLLDNEAGKVAFSKVATGSKSYDKTSFSETKSSDRKIAAIEAAVKNIVDDSAFRDAVLGRKPSADSPQAGDGLVEVDFAPKPENCDIEIDGKYVGGSPLKRRLKPGAEYKVRISKTGFKDWQGTITAESGLRISRELEAQ